MRRPVVFSYARLRPAMVRSFPAPKPSTTVQNNAAGSTCRSRFTAPVERASATRNTAGKSLRRASRIGTAFSRAIGCSSSFGKPEVRSMARPSSQKAAIIAQIVRTDSLNRTPMDEGHDVAAQLMRRVGIDCTGRRRRSAHGPQQGGQPREQGIAQLVGAAARGSRRFGHLLDRRVGKTERAKVLTSGEQQGGNEQGGDGRADFGYTRHRSSVV